MSRSRLWAAAGAAPALAGAAATVVAGAGPSFHLGASLTQTLLLVGVGAVLSARRAALPIGALLLAAGALEATSMVIEGYLDQATQRGWPGVAVLAWVDLWVWVGWVVPLTTVVLLLFPDGRTVSQRWRPVLWVCVVAALAIAAGSATAPGAMPAGSSPDVNGPDNPFAAPAAWSGWLDGVGLAAWTAGAGLAIASLAVRWRLADGARRGQLGYLLLAALAIAAIYLGVPLLPAALVDPLLSAVPVLLVAGIGLGVLRYRLYDMELVVRTTVVYAVLTGLVLGTYAALVIGIPRLLGARASPLGTLLASLGVAVGAEPVRRRVQERVGRLLYGHRDRPIEALALLRARLAGLTGAGEVLPAIAATVAGAMHAPYAALFELRGGRAEEVARVGTPVTPALQVPLLVLEEQVGTLALAPRTPNETFNRADRALIDELAAQAAAAMHALRLVDDLDQARRRTLEASIEERRRLFTDLHDGLGPHLAGARLALDGVRRGLRPGDPAATAITGIGTAIAAAATEVRRILDAELADPLCDLRLAPAITAYLDRLGPGDPRWTISADPGPLPAVVELTAYRIVLEAVTNVMRHARARNGHVSLHRDGDVLDVRVTDDGAGLGERYVTGVGIPSMRERAAVLGGTLAVRPGSPGGTEVRARLPLVEAAS